MLILVYFNLLRETQVETDASGWVIGGILSQLVPNQLRGGQWTPIAFFSRKMTPVETQYNTYNVELLAVIESLKE